MPNQTTDCPGLCKDNEVGITISESGWDSEMVAFPYIVDNYMFYSGNGFGREGFGYATIL